MVPQQVSFVERLSLSQRVPYRRFHCIVLPLLFHDVVSLHPLHFIEMSFPLNNETQCLTHNYLFSFKELRLITGTVSNARVHVANHARYRRTLIQISYTLAWSKRGYYKLLDL